MIRKIIHGFALVFCFIVFMLGGMGTFLLPWFPVADAGFPLVGVVVATLYEVGWLAFIVDQFLKRP